MNLKTFKQTPMEHIEQLAKKKTINEKLTVQDYIDFVENSNLSPADKIFITHSEVVNIAKNMAYEEVKIEAIHNNELKILTIKYKSTNGKVKSI